jgi:hypothetical protein
MNEERLERLERRLDELDKRSTAMERAMERAMDRSRAAMDTMLPSETRGHIKAAGRENLLAVRSLLDFWIDRLGQSPQRDSSNGSRENIPID